MLAEIERCRDEIAALEVLLRDGHPDVLGICEGLRDWHAELRLLAQNSRALLEGEV